MDGVWEGKTERLFARVADGRMGEKGGRVNEGEARIPTRAISSFVNDAT